MIRRTLVSLVVGLLVIASQADAQTCGHGVPCQPVPWAVPKWPELRSPTPADWGDGIVVPTPTPTGVIAVPTDVPATFTPVPTLTAFVDTSDIADSVSTMQAVINRDDDVLLNAEGTPVDNDSFTGDIGSGSATLFGYIRGIEANVFGPFSPLFTAVIAIMLGTLAFKATTFVLPMIVAVLGLLRKLVQIVLDFLPL